MDTKQFVIVIPALNPDDRLVQLVNEITPKLNAAFVIVDDGSRADREYIFNKLETECDCIVLRHGVNRGKGEALKTAATYIAEHFPDCLGYITADADYQHLPDDIIKIAHALEDYPDSFIAGVRDFSGQHIPFKSRWGNRITSTVFYLQTGVVLADTQTGLRAIPSGLIKTSAEISGSRFEYEMNVLLHLAKKGVNIVKIPINTVYETEKHVTNFRAVTDSVLIYRKILKFGLSSLSCALIDFGLFNLFLWLLFAGEDSGIMASTVCARLISGACNFLLNKYVVFNSKKSGNSLITLLKYTALFLAQMLASGKLTELLSTLGLVAGAAKIIIDSVLFMISYFIQKRFVFNKKELDTE